MAIAAAPDVLADPFAAVLFAPLGVRRAVPRPPQTSFYLGLQEVGLTDELLRTLPTLRVGRLYLKGDPVTADAVVAFIECQPNVREVRANNCPAARGDGPARIAAALEGR